ncbi:MAG: hypothetical protein M5U16_05430 [Hyphomicrobium sp.]|nr:hypothetical protein [Hyphomicrobium sp.]
MRSLTQCGRVNCDYMVREVLFTPRMVGDIQAIHCDVEWLYH